MIWDYETGSLAKSFEVSELPVRCAKFIARKQWFVAASDDMRVRIFNYNTMEKVKEFEAHADYIRCLEVHPSLPYVLSSYTLEGHERGVNCVDYYPSGDKPYILSGADDQTVKIWDYQVSKLINSSSLP
jgi:coatomer subunit beta'